MIRDIVEDRGWSEEYFCLGGGRGRFLDGEEEGEERVEDGGGGDKAAETSERKRGKNPGIILPPPVIKTFAARGLLKSIGNCSQCQHQ